MLDVLHKDYIRTARAKGLPEGMVIHKHASKNAMITVLTVAGRLVIYLLTGTVIIETIFNRPGMGKFVAFAAQQLDYAGILGGTLFFSLVLVLGNLIVDVLYAVYDPRIQLS
jgi:peptide/nickel transport system permease protein